MNSAKNFIYSGGTHLDYLQSSFKLLIRSYNDLIRDGYNASGNNENRIRDDLVRIAEGKPADLNYRWITELPDLKKNNRIDIELITPLNLVDKNLGIKIECKIVGENEYISRNGISSFVSGKYADKIPLAGMIGFIKEGSIEKKIDNIKSKISIHKTIKTIQNILFYRINNKFKYSYLSKHHRATRKSVINLYHLFFDFNSK
ncbi:hypothetical protein KAI92_02730 [Candidatus Parcubacteria bacterium]|nr:hypothetical protein [Candidatus Parcubacteria bacterium]